MRTLPDELQLAIAGFSTSQNIEVIEGTSSAAQQANVIAVSTDSNGSKTPLINTHHLLITRDAVSMSITAVEIGFCKQDASGQLSYATHSIDAKSSLFRYITERPLTFTDSRCFTEDNNLLLFKYAIPEIKSAKGLTKHPMWDVLQLAKTCTALYQLFSQEILIKYAYKKLLHHQTYHEIDFATGSDLFTRILTSHPEFVDPNYGVIDTGGRFSPASSWGHTITDTSLARTWLNPTVMQLALVHRQKFVFEIIAQVIFKKLDDLKGTKQEAEKSATTKELQYFQKIKADVLQQCEDWDYPCFFVVGMEGPPNAEGLDKGIYLYRQDKVAYALVVHNAECNETLDLVQCFTQHDLMLERVQKELGKIEWPNANEKPDIVPAKVPLPVIVLEAIFHYMQHPNGLKYIQDNLLAEGVRILDADDLVNFPAEEDRYKQEVVTHNGYHLIIKMKPGNPDQDQLPRVVSCELGLKDPVTKAYRRIAVPVTDPLFNKAGDLHKAFQEAKDQFDNRFRHYVTRDQRDLLLVENFLKTQNIARHIKEKTTRVNLFSLWCGSQNHVDRHNGWYREREYENLHTMIYKLLRAVPPEFLQMWMSSPFPWMSILRFIESLVQSWSPSAADFACVNFDSSLMHPLSVFLGSNSYTPVPRRWDLDRSGSVPRVYSPAEAMAAAPLCFAEAGTQTLQNLKVALKMQ